MRHPQGRRAHPTPLVRPLPCGHLVCPSDSVFLHNNSLVGKKSLYNLLKVLTTVPRKIPYFRVELFLQQIWSNMSSQDLEGESYVADYIADPKVYRDSEHYGWTT